MIDHCEFPYGEPAVLFGGDVPGLLLLLLVFAVGVAVGIMATNVRRRRAYVEAESID